MIAYAIGTSGQSLVVPRGVLDHFRRHRQREPFHREAGGQLFARFDGPRIVIEQATGPRRGDRRGPTFYLPDRRAEQAEILRLHPRGLHYVGDWHTHPEKQPRPSRQDLASIAETVAKSSHDLRGFVLVVVGQAEPPRGLHVSIHDGVAGFALELSECSHTIGDHASLTL